MPISTQRTLPAIPTQRLPPSPTLPNMDRTPQAVADDLSTVSRRTAPSLSSSRNEASSACAKKVTKKKGLENSLKTARSTKEIEAIAKETAHLKKYFVNKVGMRLKPRDELESLNKLEQRVAKASEGLEAYPGKLGDRKKAFVARAQLLINEVKPGVELKLQEEKREADKEEKRKAEARRHQKQCEAATYRLKASGACVGYISLEQDNKGKKHECKHQQLPIKVMTLCNTFDHELANKIVNWDINDNQGLREFYATSVARYREIAAQARQQAKHDQKARWEY